MLHPVAGKFATGTPKVEVSTLVAPFDIEEGIFWRFKMARESESLSNVSRGQTYLEEPNADSHGRKGVTYGDVTLDNPLTRYPFPLTL